MLLSTVMTRQFQSTRPVRGATLRLRYHQPNPSISIHAPRAGRDGLGHQRRRLHPHISIHAPRAGRDPGQGGAARHPRDFNPRAPCGARHAKRPSACQRSRISIHAPRAGRDRRRCWMYWPWTDFNPRAPCGARPPLSTSAMHTHLFQSTRPVRGATRRLFRGLSTF